MFFLPLVQGPRHDLIFLCVAVCSATLQIKSPTVDPQGLAEVHLLDSGAVRLHFWVFPL